MNEETDNSLECKLFTGKVPSPLPVFKEPEGPHWHRVTGNLVTGTLITENITKAFEQLPIHGKPSETETIDAFLERKVRQFVGDIPDDEYYNLIEMCSPKHLETGTEMKMSTSVPTIMSVPLTADCNYDSGDCLRINARLAVRKKLDPENKYIIKLKYRQGMVMETSQPSESEEEPLEPGRDLVYYVRFYRPRHSSHNNIRPRPLSLSREVWAGGRQRLSALRDGLVCVADVCTGLDASAEPAAPPPRSARALFPSSFLFLADVFYVDERPGRTDLSAPVREWARRRGIGTFETRALSTRLEEAALRLGHPGVLVHQGDCEHVVVVSGARVADARDAARGAGAVRQAGRAQAKYCTACAAHGARWLVAGCERVPFEPTLLCETCFRQYLYVDGRKAAAFRAYLYRGNELNPLRPQH